MLHRKYLFKATTNCITKTHKKKLSRRDGNYEKFCVTMKSKFNLLRQICWNHLMKIIKIIFKKSTYTKKKKATKKINIKKQTSKLYERVVCR